MICNQALPPLPVLWNHPPNSFSKGVKGTINRITGGIKSLLNINHRTAPLINEMWEVFYFFTGVTICLTWGVYVLKNCECFIIESRNVMQYTYSLFSLYSNAASEYMYNNNFTPPTCVSFTCAHESAYHSIRAWTIEQVCTCDIAGTLVCFDLISFVLSYLVQDERSQMFQRILKQKYICCKTLK